MLTRRISCPIIVPAMPPIPTSNAVPGNTYGATMAYQTARFWLMSKFGEANCMTTDLDVYLDVREIVNDEDRFFEEMRKFGG